MKKQGLALVALLAATACAAERHVVLISVDGLAAFYLNDPKAPIPTLRKLMAQGATASGMVVTFPSSTWPSHTTLITGAAPARHGLLGNAVIDRATGRDITYIGDPEFTKDQCVRVPTLYDAAHQAGLKTASVIWPATVGAKTLDWAIPDTNRPEVLARSISPGLVAELDAAGIPTASLPRWGWQKDYSGPRDLTYTRIAEHLLKKHRPSLTLLHLVTPDGHQHNYGPRTDEAYWAIGSADDRIRQIWEALQAPGLAGRSTLIVVSDHGFAPYDRVIYPNVVLKEMGLEGKARFQGGIGGVYLLDRSNLAERVARIQARLAAVEGVDRVLTAAEFMPLGLPDPEKQTQQADLMLSPKPGYSFSNEAKGTAAVGPKGALRGAHGHLPDQDFAHATFIAVGAGVKPGRRLGKISSMDVAPTIAAILGVKLPTAQGKTLKLD
jgi:predicted AlkP superfamily pyrophosphatase or phosphodiesterase